MDAERKISIPTKKLPENYAWRPEMAIPSLWCAAVLCNAVRRPFGPTPILANEDGKPDRI